MNQALTERKEQSLVGPNEWAAMKEQAGMLIKTGFLPPSIKTAEQVIMIAMTGRELGIGMMEAIRGVNVIAGKPSVSPQLMLALAIRTGQMQSYDMKLVDGSAVVTVTRKGWPAHEVRFGKAEADAMGLTGKDNYKKQATVMYKWRALAEALRFTFPDAVSGIYTFDEVGANMSVEGELVGEPQPLEPTFKAPQEKPAVQAELPEPKKIGISDTERKKLFAFAKSAYGEGYELKLREYLKTEFLIESTTELDPLQFIKALNHLADLAKKQDAPL